jgi:hypothetical protein
MIGIVDASATCPTVPNGTADAIKAIPAIMPMVRRPISVLRFGKLLTVSPPYSSAIETAFPEADGRRRPLRIGFFLRRRQYAYRQLLHPKARAARTPKNLPKLRACSVTLSVRPPPTRRIPRRLVVFSSVSIQPNQSAGWSRRRSRLDEACEDRGGRRPDSGQSAERS